MKTLKLAAGGRKNGKVKHRIKLPKGSSPTCPHCHKRCKSEVTDSRQSGDTIRRRRTCLSCGWRYTTRETTVIDNLDTVREWLSEHMLPAIEALFSSNKP